MSTEHREWLIKVLEAQESAEGPSNIPLPPGPLYVECPECKGSGGRDRTLDELKPIFEQYGIELISMDDAPPV
jgi:hypothetical protein